MPVKNNPPRIYLDQNAWIALAQAYYKKAGAERFEEPMQAIIKASEADLVRVPLSFNHMIEVCASPDMERRKRLAGFMVKVSRQYAIVPFMLTRHDEIIEAVMRRFGITQGIIDHKKVVQKGLWCALGIQPTFDLTGVPSDKAEAFMAAISADDMAIKMLSEWMSSDDGRELRQSSEREADLVDKIRQANIEVQGRDGKRVADTMAVAREILMPLALEECGKIGMKPEKVWETLKTDADLAEFAYSVPSFDVLLSLMLARDDDVQRKVDRNDMRDVGFLASAIPYCDVAIVERYFGTMAKRVGLDTKYNCTVLTDVTELTKVLADVAVAERQ